MNRNRSQFLRTPSRFGRGYTLLELVLVLAILATFLGMAAASLRTFAAGRKAEDAARQFLSVTRWARSQAVSDGVSYQLTIEPSTGTWQLSLAEEEADQEIPAAYSRVFTVPENVTIETTSTLVNGKHAIIFDPTGKNDPVEIHFVGPNSDVTVICEAPAEDFRILRDDGRRG